MDALVAQMDAFAPDVSATERALALYSAAVTLADERVMTKAIEVGLRCGLKRHSFYEIVLQSYLFLGFPRMLIAAENLNRVMPESKINGEFRPISTSESQQWFDNGIALYKRVYGRNNQLLMDRVSAMAPEVFRWMIIEGYGKVLSRPAVGVISRELSIIAFLMMENRERQLHSHIRGALNVGASPDLVRLVISDIGSAAGDGLESARKIINQLTK